MVRILVACEESQAVSKAFRALGHESFSADILPCSGGHPEWHIKGDVLPLINGYCEFNTQDGNKHTQHGEWSMIIAFPPCTHLAVSGAAHFAKKIADGRQQEGIDFFMEFANAKCDKIMIENPVGIMSTKWRKPDQKIHPWMFGDNYAKTTCLWLKGLPKLKQDVIEEPKLDYFEWTCKKTGKKKRQPQWFYDCLKLSAEERAKARSKTFPGIAKAMAEQWSNFASQEKQQTLLNYI